MSPLATVEAPKEEPTTSAPAKVLSSDQGFWTIAWRMFRKDRASVAALIVVGLLAGLAIFGPFLASGYPYTIKGVLTNFYSNDIAAFLDWHRLYRQRADELGDADKWRPAERVEKEAEAELYREGLPQILGRLEDYMKPEDGRAFRVLAAKYEKLLAVPAAQLDREEHEKLGRDIEEQFGALAFEPAYKRVARPLLVFSFGLREGDVPLRKRALDAAEEARYAKEDNDPKALAAANKKLEALAPDLETIAKQVESAGAAMADFLADQDKTELAGSTAELGKLIRAFGTEAADEKVASRFTELSTRVDELARRPIPREKQRLPLATQHPIIDAMSGRDIGFIVLYVTVALAIVFAKSFIKATGKIPVDPGDLALVRLGIIAAPAITAGILWSVSMPARTPPSESYYKQFAAELAARPDPSSSISFAPVPFGENENIQIDKVSPPTWIEDEGHKVLRLMATPGEKLPEGVTKDDVVAYYKPESPVTGAKRDAIVAWKKDLVARRLDNTRFHWLGTDRGGRDVLARIIIGSRVSLSVGFVAVGLNVIIGLFLGAIAGYFRGWTDIIISRFTEIVLCIPTFFLILALVRMIPPWIPTIWAIMLVLGLINWTGEMRLIRGEFLRLGGLDFVTAGRALGLSNSRVIFRHILPNAMAPVLVAATFGIAGAILTESALSFLGFGIQPPAASWGSVLNEAFGAEKEMWWITIFPGFMIFVTITAYNLVGEGFRDATDPRLRK